MLVGHQTYVRMFFMFITLTLTKSCEIIIGKVMVTWDANKLSCFWDFLVILCSFQLVEAWEYFMALNIVPLGPCFFLTASFLPYREYDSFLLMCIERSCLFQ